MIGDVVSYVSLHNQGTVISLQEISSRTHGPLEWPVVELDLKS